MLRAPIGFSTISSGTGSAVCTKVSCTCQLPGQVERQAAAVKPPARGEPNGAEPQQVAAAPPSAAEPEPAPAPVASVDQRCAGSANFIARDVCRIRACGTPALAGDPVCVRFREMEEANRNRTSQ